MGPKYDRSGEKYHMMMQLIDGPTMAQSSLSIKSKFVEIMSLETILPPEVHAEDRCFVEKE